MTFYSILVLIHVVAAVVGMGPAFIFHIVIKFATTREQLIFSNNLLARLEKFVKIGSILLLITGTIMGFLNPSLFTKIWYISSIVLYFVAQIFVIGIAGKNTKRVVTILEQTESNIIPDNVVLLNKSISNALLIASFIAVIMIGLMTLKPF